MEPIWERSRVAPACARAVRLGRERDGVCELAQDGGQHLVLYAQRMCVSASAMLSAK